MQQSRLEVLGYAIPWFDHILDLVATPAAIMAGTVMTASLAPELDPLAKWTLALVAGGGTAGFTKAIMNLLRGTSTAATGGLANPVVAAVELGAAIALSVLALTVPLAAGVMVLGILGVLIFKGWGWVKHHRNRLGQPSPKALP